MAAPELPVVLVVEDEPAQREVLAYNLEAEGFRVARAENGEEALLLIEEETPDLIVLDWMLPGLSGIELCRRLRARPETRSLPIIMLTARGEESEKIRGLSTGAGRLFVYGVVDRQVTASGRLGNGGGANVGESRAGVGAGAHRPRSHAVVADDSEADRFVLALVRACAGAIVVGSGTLLSSPEGTWRIAHPRLAQDYRLNVGVIVEEAMLDIRLLAKGRPAGGGHR